MSAATSTFRASVTPVDAELITQLHAAHGSAIFDFARHLGLNDEEAADVVQEAMLRFSRELVRGTVIERPPAWIYRTAYRLAMEQHRWRRRLGMLMTQLAPRHPGFEDTDSSDRVAVWSEVDRLPLRQRQVLYLRYASDLAFDDIASILGVSTSAARTHASRALVSLRSA